MLATERGGDWRSRTLAPLSFIVSIAYLPGTISAAEVGRWLCAALGTAALIFFVRIRFSLWHWLFAALIVWSILGFLWSGSPLDTIGAWPHLLMAFAAFCIGYALEDIDGLWDGLGWAAVVSALFAVLQWYGLHPVFEAGSNRPAGLFLNADVASEFGLVVLIGALFANRLAFVPAATGLLMLGGSRAAFVGFAAAIMLWVRDNYRAAFPATLGFACLGIAALWISYLGGWRSESVDEHVMIWTDTLKNLRWFGWGIGSYAALFPEYEYAHSEPLGLVFELGVGALLAVPVFAASVSARSGRDASSYALVAVIVASLFGFTFHAPAMAFVGALLAGHLCARYDHSAGDERSGRDGDNAILQNVQPYRAGTL